MVKYKFTNVDRSTISENIRIGFTTTHSQGFLISLFSNLSNEYLTISLTNGGEFSNYPILLFRFTSLIKTIFSGDIRVIFDFGFERQELIYRGKNFALGQFHDLRLTRKNSGSSIFLQVPNRITSTLLNRVYLFNVDVLNKFAYSSRLTTKNLKNILFVLEVLRMFSLIKFSIYILGKTNQWIEVLLDV